MRLLLLIIFIYGYLTASAQPQLRIMMIFAHPDEGEVYTGGTTALYTQMGHKVKFMSLTNGDAGHWEMKPEALAKRRYQEAMNAKKILGVDEYEILDYHDQGLKNTKESQAKVIKSIEAYKPDVVFTYYPAQGGHIDNMTAGYIVRDAAKNLKMEKLPVFLYVRDYHTSTFSYIPHIAFSIDKVWQTKLAACAEHKSQVEEAIPHGLGILEEVRKDPRTQQQLIDDNTYAFSKVFPWYTYALEKWYGRKAAAKIKYAEAFEIAEFGRQVSEDELLSLVPMLEKSYVVQGTKDWTDPGIEVKEGDVLNISAEGTVEWKKEGREKCDANGAVPYTRWGKKPVLSAPTGALIARIGVNSGESFLVGTDRQLIAWTSGKLYFGINDDNTGDNDGAYRVWVTKGNKNEN